MVKVKEKQSIFDITVQEFGQIDNVVQISADNEVSVSERLATNLELEVDTDNEGDNDIKKVFIEKGISVNNDVAPNNYTQPDAQDLKIESMDPVIDLAVIVAPSAQDMDIETQDPTIVLDEITLSVSPGQMDFDNTGAPCFGFTVTVTATPGNSWTAVSNQGWATVVGGSGTGNGSFTITTPVYGGPGDRNAIITVSSSAPDDTVDVLQFDGVCA